MKRFAILLAAAGSMVCAASAAQAGCQTVVGSADMITRDLAKFMAEAALKNAIAGKNMKPAGETILTCRDDTVTTYCKASRRACS